MIIYNNNVNYISSFILNLNQRSINYSYLPIFFFFYLYN